MNTLTLKDRLLRISLRGFNIFLNVCCLFYRLMNALSSPDSLLSFCPSFVMAVTDFGLFWCFFILIDEE